MSDLISRQAALNAICGILTHGQALECERRINALPPAQLKTQLSEEDATSDCISRQAAIDEIKALYEWHDTVTEDRAVDHLKRLPSSEPEAKEIGYAECANAMVQMWIDTVLTDGEYHKIMDKLSAHWRKKNG